MTAPMPANPDFSQAQRIEPVCTAYEAACQAGTAACLEEWLHQAQTADRLALLRELLLLEVYYRRQRGELPQAKDYQQRFPQLDAVWLADAVTPPVATVRRGQAALTTNGGASAGAPQTIQYAGDYELLEEIGRGGIGVVYQGQDRDLNRTLAIKVLQEKHQDNAELRRRFLEEAQIMGQLQHPGVAPIHEVGQLADGRPFFSMKRIQGQTLADLLKTERPREPGSASAKKAATSTDQVPDKHTDQHAAETMALPQLAASAPVLPPRDLARFLGIFEHVCQTVAAAHSRGILHRDLKPGNIMVGAFGEVQVMDWGLAKLLSPANRWRPPESPASDQVTTIVTARTSAPEGADTAAGRILGTPAYMAPEQARGEVENLDERCDVFGLGAILCEVLTGRPPFPGDTQVDSHRRAMKGDVQEALTRLAGCRVDPELRQLAQRCLAADKLDRPRSAAAVATALADYQASVRERLRQAEIERTAAQVKAAEERKRRLVSLALAGSVAAIILAAASASVWYYYNWAEQTQKEAARNLRSALARETLKTDLAAVVQQRHELHQRLENAQTAAYLLSEIREWRSLIGEMRDRWNKAKALADSHKDVLAASWFTQLETLDRQLKADEQDWQWAKELDDNRLENFGLDALKDRVVASYAQSFRKRQLDVVKGDVAVVASRVARSPIRYALVAALDEWVQILPQVSARPFPGASTVGLLGSPLGQGPCLAAAALVPERIEESGLRSRLLAIARRADPDPWRDQVRNLQVWRDRAKLMKLAREVPMEKQTPQLLLLLVLRVHGQAGRKEARALLQRALFHYPRDFWLHLGAVDLEENPKAKADCLRAALVMRPDSSGVLFNLGVFLERQRDYDGAIEHFRKAIKYARTWALPHNYLARALLDKGEPDSALPHLHRAIALDPKYPNSYLTLGTILARKGNLDDAIAHFRQALNLAPNYVTAHVNLGAALYGKGDSKGAIEHYQKALALDPQMAAAYAELAALGGEPKDLEAVTRDYQLAFLAGRSADGHTQMGISLVGRGNLDGGIAHFQQALALDPELTAAYTHLGAAFYHKKDFGLALFYCHKALALDPNDAGAYLNLAQILKSKGDVNGAIRHFRKAIALDPKMAEDHSKIGAALYARGNLGGAVIEYQTVIDLDPHNAKAHCILGAILEDKNNRHSAIQHYRTALALDPALGPAHLRLGNALARQRDLDGAIPHFYQAIKLDPKTANGYASLGGALYQKKDLDRALLYCRAAVARDARYAEGHVNLGQVLLAQGDVHGALAQLQEALALAPNLVEGHIGLSQALFAKGDLDGAIRQCHKVIDLDPKNALAYANLGGILQRKNNLDGAIKHLRQAIALDSRLSQAHFNLGLALRAKGNLKGAIEHYHIALDLDPNDAQAHYSLGNALMAQGDLEGAATHFRQAIALSPNFAEAHCNLGHVLSQQGQLGEALKAFQRGHELGRQQADFHYPAAEWVKSCARLVELDQKLPLILKGVVEPANTAEMLELADLCRKYKKSYVAAAHFCLAAVKAEPGLAQQRRFAFAGTAILAATGQSRDAILLRKEEPAELRQRALSWLREELANLKQQLAADPSPTALARQKLKYWQTTPNLVSVREARELAKLPEGERLAWQQLWREVAQVLGPAAFPGKDGS